MSDSVDKWLVKRRNEYASVLGYLLDFEQVADLIRDALADPVLMEGELAAAFELLRNYKRTTLELSEQLAEAKRDTERLEWAMTHDFHFMQGRMPNPLDRIRKHIDAAMSSQAACGKAGGQP